MGHVIDCVDGMQVRGETMDENDRLIGPRGDGLIWPHLVAAAAGSPLADRHAEARL
jgi:hypothetical protein